MQQAGCYLGAGGSRADWHPAILLGAAAVTKLPHVEVTLILLLDKGRPASSLADALGLDNATVYRYAHAWQQLGWEKYLLREARSYWGLLGSASWATLSRDIVGATGAPPAGSGWCKLCPCTTGQRGRAWARLPWRA